MREGTRAGLVPGMSVLGGAAGGFTYEGALRDALAPDDRRRRLQAGEGRRPPPQQVQATRPPAPAAQAARQQG